MDQRCTCGAVLPEDARFCHKCGKPQFEEDIARLNAQEQAPPAPPPISSQASTRIGFGNLRAVLITMAVAALSLLPLGATGPMALALAPPIICAAGFLSAWFYGNRSLERLSPGNGAFLGVMTGIWLFLVFLIGASILAICVTSPETREALKAAMPRIPPEALKILDDPHQFMIGMLGSLVPIFLVATVSAALGGLIAARFTHRGRPSS